MKRRQLLQMMVLAFAGWACAAAGGPKPLEVGVFAGVGPRSNGCVEWFRLVAGSPEMNVTFLDAARVRDGWLKKIDLLVMPGGSSILIKKDLAPAGVAALKRFIFDGGGYIGTCAGCSLLMEEKEDAARGISVIPYGRLGSKGKFLMPVAINGKGAAALGIEEGEYPVRYSAGPVLFPSTNVIEGASFEVWGTYAGDFDCPKSALRMKGHGAIVGGTYGKGKVFAIATHPESFPMTHFILQGAFRYVAGREVTFPPRARALGALTVGYYSPVIAGCENAETVVALDRAKGLDLFPVAAEEIKTGMLDHIDYLVLPDGVGDRYATLTALAPYLKAYAARGGRFIGWGKGNKFLPVDGIACPDGRAVVAHLTREAQANGRP